MTDSERLNALGNYGLCIATYDSLNTDGWERTWVCQYWVDGAAKIMMGEDLRHVIDSAVLDIQTQGATLN